MTLKTKEILHYEDVQITDEEKAFISAFVKKHWKVWDKMHTVTEIVMGNRALHWKMTPDEARGAVAYSKYIKGYFSQVAKNNT